MYKFFVILLLILILLNTCMGCTFMVAKETAKAIDIILNDDPNPEKKTLDEDTLDLFDDLLQELACYPQEVVSDKDYKQVEDMYFKLGGE